MIGQFVILRSRDDGVVCGFLKSLVPQPGGLFAAEVEEARIIHHWQQNNQNYTLYELSLRGVVPPATARISVAVPLHTMAGVCGVTPCSEEAQENLSQSRWNTPFDSSLSSRQTGRKRGK